MVQRIEACVIIFVGVLVGGAETAPLFPDERPKKAFHGPDAELDAIVKAWNEGQAMANQAYKQAKTKEERQKAMPERPGFESYAERCIRLVDTHPQTPAAMHALVFVVSTAPTAPHAARAIELLKPRVAEADLEYLRNHLLGWFPYGMADLAPLVFAKAKAKPEDANVPGIVAWVCLAAGHGDPKDTGKLFREAVEYLVQHHGDSLHPWSVLQYVNLAQERDALWAEQQLRAILAVNKNDQVRRLGAYTLAALLARRGEASQTEAEKWIRECLRISQGMKQKKVDGTEGKAQLLLAKIQRLGLGKAAPEIAGQDLDGQTFQLSDYRGKVVLLDFWGFW